MNDLKSTGALCHAVCRKGFRKNGFTITEMLVALSILTVLMVIIGQFVQSTSSITSFARSRLSVDDQVRLTMSVLSQDIGQMVKRSDTDYYFASEPGNDKLFFYAEVASYMDTSSAPPSSVSMVGYRINSATSSPFYNTLERCTSQVDWGGTGSSGILFLTPKAKSGGGTYSFDPLPRTTLSLVTNPDLNAWADPNSALYQQIATSIFRFEVCYLLRDGSYSTLPILQTAPTTWIASRTFYSSKSSGPTATDDTAAGFAVDSRWYDTTGKRGYICTRAATGQSKWEPIGWRDVSAVIVTVACLDDAKREVVKSLGKDMNAASSALVDASNSDLSQSDPILPAQRWLATVASPSYAATAGLPASVAGSVRVYERHLYVNSQ